MNRIKIYVILEISIFRSIFALIKRQDVIQIITSLTKNSKQYEKFILPIPPKISKLPTPWTPVSRRFVRNPHLWPPQKERKKEKQVYQRKQLHLYYHHHHHSPPPLPPHKRMEKVRSSSFRSPFSHCTNFVNVRSIGGGASSLWMEKDEKREAVETGRRVPDAQRPRREGRGEAGLTLNSESAGVDPAATASATLLPRFRLPGAAPPSTNPLCVALACAWAPPRHAHAATTFCIKSFVYGPRRFIGRAMDARMALWLLDLG